MELWWIRSSWRSDAWLREFGKILQPQLSCCQEQLGNQLGDLGLLACREAYEFGQLGTGLSWFRQYTVLKADEFF